jgi:hypothetical protein
MKYDEKTLRKIRELLTSESGRTESWEATVEFIDRELAGNSSPYSAGGQWERYDESH